MKPRCKTTWASCYSSLPPNLKPIQYHLMNHSALASTPLNIGSIYLDDEQPMSPLTDLDDLEDMDIEKSSAPDSVMPPVYVIETKYNPKSDINTASKCPRRTNSRDLYYDTQKERHLAEKAKVAASLDDLKKKVGIF